MSYGSPGGGPGGVTALAAFDLKIDEGEFVAVVGPSGCGKSTLMKLVAGLQRPTAGGIAIGGHEVAGPLKIVGMAFQNPSLLPWRTALDNVLLPLEIVQPHRSRLRRERAQYRARASAMLASVGLAEATGRYPWQLSGGMQQRVSLCRALIHEPALLLLDEPFGALDTFTREELWETLQALWLARRFTGILVTHDLEEAAFLADRVVVIAGRPGRVVANRRVELDRPRSPADRYRPDFVDMVRALRGEIGRVREAA
jgi:NitT/TauT family transport system ATP-binding protein